MRELSQLIGVDEPAWPELRETLDASPVSVEVLPPDGDVGGVSILQLQVTARSYLGAVVLHCGGLVVDDGWLRVFGSPSSGAEHGLAGLARVNQFRGTFDPAWRPETGLVVAHDVLGGVFALNGAAPADADRPGPWRGCLLRPRFPSLGGSGCRSLDVAGLAGVRGTG